jgi:proteasome component ECM29
MDYYTEVKAMLFSVLDDEEDNDGGDDDGHDKPLQLMVMASAAKALGMAWTRNEQVQSEYNGLVL